MAACRCAPDAGGVTELYKLHVVKGRSCEGPLGNWPLNPQSLQGMDLQVRWYKDAATIARVATVLDAATSSGFKGVCGSEGPVGCGGKGRTVVADGGREQYRGWLGFLQRMCNEPAPTFQATQEYAAAEEVSDEFVVLTTLCRSQFCGEHGCLTGLHLPDLPAG